MVAIARANNPLAEVKVSNGKRINRAAGLLLANSPDLLALGALATGVRERLHDQAVFVTPTQHLTLVRQDAASLAFAGEDRDEGEDPALLMTLDEYVRAQPRYAATTAWHIVVGDPDRIGWEVALEAVHTIRQLAPHAQLRAFSAADVWRWSQTTRLDLATVLTALRAAGVAALTGGGTRGCLVPLADWPNTTAWLAVHRDAHRLGMTSSATLLYGLGETVEQRVAWLLAVRALQDETGGFTHGVVVRQPHTPGSLVATPSAIEDLRVTALCRLLLDNVAHITRNWDNVSLELAQAALQFGVDTLDGTLAPSAGQPGVSLAAIGALSRLLQREISTPH